MKKSKIIVPALGLIALGTAASITGTVAWFSMNKSVIIRGMEVKTSVSSNLLIASDTLDSVAKKADNLFSAGPLAQSVKGILEPVSSVDGENFFYTKLANADGSKASGNYIEYTSANATDTTHYDSAFSEYYEITRDAATALISGESGAKPFVDYVFQLKAVNTSGDTQKLTVTKLDLIYGGAKDASKAYRVAFFAQDITSAAPVAGVGTDTLKMIYSESGATNQTNGKAVNSTTTVDTVTYNTANIHIDGSIDSQATKYYKVVVRLWLEGEDTTCTNSTFAALTDSWKLNLELKLGNETAISSITKYTKTTYNTHLYFCDGTYAYKDSETVPGEPGDKVLNSTTDGGTAAELQTALNSAFGFVLPATITFPAE